MRKEEMQRFDAFAAKIGDPDVALKMWQMLKSIERMQRRHAERLCNDEKYDDEEQEKAERKIRKKAEDVVGLLGGIKAQVKLSNDPRGSVVCLIIGDDKIPF